MIKRKLQAILSSDRINKWLQCYDRPNKFLDQSVKNHLRGYDNIRKIVTGQGHDYKTWSLLDYPYFKKCYKLIAIDLKDADPKGIQQVNFTGKLERDGNTQMFPLLKKQNTPF